MADYFPTAVYLLCFLTSAACAGLLARNYARTRARVVKNKIAPPFRDAEFDIMFNEGISATGDLLDLIVEFDQLSDRIIADAAALGAKALDQVWPKTRAQRCWVHRLANVLDKLPKRLQPTPDALQR